MVSVTHVLILKTTIEGRPWAFIASKQIYADHYFVASLGLTVLAQESADPANELISVAYFNRSHTDGLQGWFSSVEGSIVERHVRYGILRNLSDSEIDSGRSIRFTYRNNRPNSGSNSVNPRNACVCGLLYGATVSRHPHFVAAAHRQTAPKDLRQAVRGRLDRLTAGLFA